ncbi:uncharacterized protein LOC120123363 [Hibiscus syriacus]|uniref:uncharacterized protein LOC120123363 n=1 Tax=Hibiscus syriacus TaxID=106335 RepID=UPI0019232197|nr:uncharacterized protein LOC120123363 [Hibiscus syriacus]
MEGASKVIMSATLIMVVSLAIVLALILVLLAELFCSLLLRWRRLKNSTSASGPTVTNTATPAPASTNTFFYISNPVYDNDAGCSKPNTLFETPNSLPSV